MKSRRKEEKGIRQQVGDVQAFNSNLWSKLVPLNPQAPLVRDVDRKVESRFVYAIRCDSYSIISLD